MDKEQPKRTPHQIIGDDALTQLIFEGYEVMPARRSSDEQAEVVGDEAMLAAVGAISELEDAILDCRTLDDLAELQTAARRRRESDLAIFNRGIALAQARLSARDEPISPGLQAAIDHTKAKIRAAFSGVTPSPAVAAGGVTEALREALTSLLAFTKFELDADMAVRKPWSTLIAKAEAALSRPTPPSRGEGE